MKKLIAVLLVFCAILFCSCGNSSSYSEKDMAYDEGYDDGYETGYEDGYDKAMKKVNKAYDYVDKAIAMIDEFEYYSLDDIYDTLCKAASALQ